MTETGTNGKDGNARYNIRVLERAIRILKVMSDGKSRTLHMLSEEISLNPSTTFRLLNSLVYNQFLRKNETTGRYQLGVACLELARAYQDSSDLRMTASPELEALRDELKETVHLAVLDQMEVVYIEKIPGLHTIGMMGSRVGGRSPAHCTGLGKVLLANLDRRVLLSFLTNKSLTRFTPTTLAEPAALIRHLDLVRQQGYAVDQGEHEPDVRCVAAPIYDHTGIVVAAISISGPSARMDPVESNTRLIERTRLAADAISYKLGSRPVIEFKHTTEEK